MRLTLLMITEVDPSSYRNFPISKGFVIKDAAAPATAELHYNG